MKKNIITIRLDDNLGDILSDVCQKSGKSRSDVIREALKRQLLIYKFNQLRNSVLRYGEKLGFLTDEDIFSVVS
jgi:metal-responsive CopG/Arc/MetJ family transcriptional regulator